MKIQKKQKINHSCKAIVFSCIDWRLHLESDGYFQKKYKTFDMFYTAGSIKGFLEKENRRLFLKQIEISRTLHKSAIVALTAHHDCGAFGGMSNFKDEREEFAYYQKILEEAKNIVLGAFPDAKVEKYFIGLQPDGKLWKTSLKKIK